MNRLKKKAHKDFWTVCFFTIIALFMFGFLTYVNAKGVLYLIASFYPVCVMAVWIVIQKFRIRNNSNVLPFDEREFYLIQRSIHWGNNVFIVFVLFAIFVAFSFVGGRGMVPMWSIPVVLFCGLFLAGTVQFFVLMHHAKEDDKDMEGGAA